MGEAAIEVVIEVVVGTTVSDEDMAIAQAVAGLATAHLVKNLMRVPGNVAVAHLQAVEVMVTVAAGDTVIVGVLIVDMGAVAIVVMATVPVVGAMAEIEVAIEVVVAEALAATVVVGNVVVEGGAIERAVGGGSVIAMGEAIVTRRLVQTVKSRRSGQSLH